MKVSLLLAPLVSSAPILRHNGGGGAGLNLSGVGGIVCDLLGCYQRGYYGGGSGYGGGYQ